MALDAAGHRVHDHLRGRALSHDGAPPRRDWLDWTRGLAVVLMVLAHVVDAWTRDADRDRTAFYWTTFIGGLAAPAFLYLAGLGTALSGAAKRARGMAVGPAARALAWRGLLIFGLAFVFRFQAFVLGLGRPIDLLKVDILNVMGPAMMLAAGVWWLFDGTRGRVAAAMAVTLALAFLAPLIRTSPWIVVLPEPLQWYLRPTPSHTNFTLFPWIAFTTAGLAAGAALAGTRTPADERRLHATLGLLAVTGTAVAYWASWQPTIYPPGRSTFWGASPAFFFLRLALVTALLPVCWSIRRQLPAAVGAGLAVLGAASLFVYWVHVELVYGGVAILIKRRVPFEITLVATLVATYALARLVPAARVWVARTDERPALARRLVSRLL